MLKFSDIQGRPVTYLDSVGRNHLVHILCVDGEFARAQIVSSTDCSARVGAIVVVAQQDLSPRCVFDACQIVLAAAAGETWR